MDVTLDNVHVDGQKPGQAVAEHADVRVSPRRGSFVPRGDTVSVDDQGATPGQPPAREGRFAPFPDLPEAPAAAVAVPEEDETLYVAASGNGDYWSIQRAIDVAPQEGAVISVAPGTYRERLVVTKPNIRILSPYADARRTVITSLEVRAPGFQIENVTIGPVTASSGAASADTCQARSGEAWARGCRGPAPGRPGQRLLPQPDPRRRPPGPVDPEGRRRLLHDVLVLRRLSRPRRLALARPRELAADRPGPLRERRLGLGARPRASTAGATSSTSPRERRIPLELRRLGRSHRRAVERADRPEAAAHRPRPRGRRGRQALPLPLGRAATCRSPTTGSRRPARSKHVYDGWRYPDDWVVESFSQEGPKILKHGEYFHMILAEGGTAGPPTGHMIVVRALEVDPRPLGELALQPDRARAVGRGALVVEGARNARRGPGRPLVRRLPRLRERLPDARPADAPRARRVDGRRLGEARRARPRAADPQAERREGRGPRLRLLGRLHVEPDGRPVELLRRRPGR